MLRFAAAHGLASLAAAAWALWQFQPFGAGRGSVPWSTTLAEWAFAVLSWPLVPLARWAFGLQLRHGWDLLLLLAVLALNSLLWAALWGPTRRASRLLTRRKT